VTVRLPNPTAVAPARITGLLAHLYDCCRTRLWHAECSVGPV